MTDGPETPPGDHPDRSGVSILPPLIHVAGLAAGFLTQRVYPIAILPDPIARGLGIAMIVFAFVILFGAATAMDRARTTHSVFKPSTAIVGDGPFRFSRNPIYLGLTLIYLGVALAANAFWVLILVVPVLAALHRFVIAREERYLERKFGDDYRSYRSRVRRWL